MQRSHTLWGLSSALLSLAMCACGSNEAAEIRYTEYGVLAKKQWVTERFCEADIAASPELEVLQVGALFGQCVRGGSLLCKR